MRFMGRAEDIFDAIKREGMAAIDGFIIDRMSEELFLDFKRSADNGSGDRLHPTDRKNLGRMISGFGNSSGGVIVWGVDCSSDPKTRADLPRAKMPIHDVKRFVSWLESAVSGCTLPPHSKVSHWAIPQSTGSADGFVATLIPESPLCPHQTVDDRRYLIRAGSNCEPAPHGVLAGMFGKRPTPDIFPMFARTQPKLIIDTVEFSLGFLLAHKTPVVARDLYFSINLGKKPGPNCELQWYPDTSSGFWTWNNAFGIRYSGFTGDQFKLPPEMAFQAGTLQAKLKPPFIYELMLEVFFGCSGSPVRTLSAKTPPETINDAWKEYVVPKPAAGPSPAIQIDRNFVQEIIPFGEA